MSIIIPVLKKLRNKKIAKKIWIFLALVIIPAFIFWGSGAVSGGKRGAVYAGKIFGRKIPILEYENSLNAVKNQAIMRFGDNFPEIAKYLNLKEQAWDRLILLDEARKRKISVGDREVVELIESYPFFQRKSAFDNALYARLLESYFQTQPRAFEEEARQSLVLTKLYKQITDNIKITGEEIRKGYLKLNEQLSVYYIGSLGPDFKKGIFPTDKEIRDYYTKNQLQFKVPLSFNVEYISLSQDEKGDTAKDEIKKIAQRLNKEKNFSKIAKDFGLQVKETGFFPQSGPMPGIGWSPEILALISKLKKGEFSTIIFLDKNYYIFRIKEKKDPYIPEFETVKDKAREMFIADKSMGLAKEKIVNASEKAEKQYKSSPKSVNFNKIAKEFGLKDGSTGLFQYGSYIEGIGASDKFWTAAAQLKENEPSAIIEMPTAFYIIKLKDRLQIDEKKFEQELPTFSEQLLNQKKEESFTKFLEELKKKVQLF